MRSIRAVLCVVVVSLPIAVAAHNSCASEPTTPIGKVAGTSSAAEANSAFPAAHDTIAAEYERLGLEFAQLDATRNQAIPLDTNEPADLTLSDEQWLEQRREAQAKAPNPDALLPQFLSFAQAHSKSPLAFDALFFVVRVSAFKEFRGDGKASPVLAQALDVAWAEHKDDPRMVHLLQLLSIPTRQSEAYFKRAIDTAPNQAVRAAATYNLARYYRILAGCYERSQRVMIDKNNATLTNDERMWKLVVAPNLERYLPRSGDENSKRIDLLSQVVAEFSDVPATGWKPSGPGGIYVETVPFQTPKSYGDQAAAILYQLKYLSPGKPAPEIVGQDADGKTFRLSDYRDHVILLTFNADWCPGCVKLYPIERRLQEKFRGQPFVILSINCDESVDTLKSSIVEGDITWRCWWDGKSGPIRTAWNMCVSGLFLLDHEHGRIQTLNATTCKLILEKDRWVVRMPSLSTDLAFARRPSDGESFYAASTRNPIPNETSGEIDR